MSPTNVKEEGLESLIVASLTGIGSLETSGGYVPGQLHGFRSRLYYWLGQTPGLPLRHPTEGIRATKPGRCWPSRIIVYTNQMFSQILAAPYLGNFGRRSRARPQAPALVLLSAGTCVRAGTNSWGPAAIRARLRMGAGLREPRRRAEMRAGLGWIGADCLPGEEAEQEGKEHEDRHGEIWLASKQLKKGIYK